MITLISSPKKHLPKDMEHSVLINGMSTKVESGFIFLTKGQLISKGLFGVIVWTKKPTHFK